MKVKVECEGVVFAKNKNAKQILDALDVKVNFSEVSRKSGIAITTIYDFWKKFEKDNNMEVTIKIKGEMNGSN
jgi:predicted flavoprotein YhiN